MGENLLSSLSGLQTKDAEFVKGVARQIDNDPKMPIDAATVAQLVGEISRLRVALSEKVL